MCLKKHLKPYGWTWGDREMSWDVLKKIFKYMNRLLASFDKKQKEKIGKNDR